MLRKFDVFGFAPDTFNVFVETGLKGVKLIEMMSVYSGIAGIDIDHFNGTPF
jgi:hypothetical protein